VTAPSRPWLRPTLIGSAVVLALAGALTFEVVWTRPTRQAVDVFARLVSAANRGDEAEARRLCSARYLRDHRVEAAPGGGLVGLPRNINKNFQCWHQGRNVWICPTNRVGPVYQIVPESGGWRFDGPVALLMGRGEIVPYPEDSEADGSP
jgi:hypothetical protein